MGRQSDISNNNNNKTRYLNNMASMKMMIACALMLVSIAFALPSEIPEDRHRRLTLILEESTAAPWVWPSHCGFKRFVAQLIVCDSQKNKKPPKGKKKKKKKKKS